MAVGHRRTYITVALLVALVLAAAAAAACSAQATAGVELLSAPRGSTRRDQRQSRHGGRRQGRVRQPTGRASLAALAYMQADASDEAGGRPARRLGRPRVDGQRQELAQPDRRQGRPRHARLEHGLAQPHHGAERGHREGPAQGRPSDRLHRHQPRRVHLAAEDGVDHPAVAGAGVGVSPPAAPVRHDTTGILSTAKKKAMVQSWLAERYPVYKRNFATGAAVLETLIKTCQTRGYKPVLFELPREHRSHRQLAERAHHQVPRQVQALAAKYQIPWVSLVSAAKLPNTGFYDLWHLVEPGRTVWQNLLSAKTAALLNSDAFTMAAARKALSRRPVRVAARLSLIILLAAGLGALTLIAAPARAGERRCTGDARSSAPPRRRPPASLPTSSLRSARRRAATTTARTGSTACRWSPTCGPSIPRSRWSCCSAARRRASARCSTTTGSGRSSVAAATSSTPTTSAPSTARTRRTSPS